MHHASDYDFISAASENQPARVQSQSVAPAAIFLTSIKNTTRTVRCIFCMCTGYF